MNNVRQFTDSELLNRVESIGGTIPNPGDHYLIIGVQSLEDDFNLFDDKFYIFDGNRFVMVTTGTTNAGKTALKYFARYNLPGAAVWKTNEFYKGLYRPGLHKGRMKALRQSKPIKYFRDSDRDDKSEETGAMQTGIIYANFHGVNYDFFSNSISSNINGWSFGCQVVNRMGDYRQIIRATWKRNRPVDYALLKEW